LSANAAAAGGAGGAAVGGAVAGAEAVLAAAGGVAWRTLRTHRPAAANVTSLRFMAKALTV
jgi:hypothetical protein